jgi:hypothetical protein
MADQNEKKVEVKEGASKMPLGVAMDMAEYAVKGKSTEERNRLGQKLSVVGKIKPGEGKDKKFNLTPQQKTIVEKLNSAKNSEQRVRIFATIADDIGLDPLISLIPELGDAGSSIVSGVYLLYEAKKAGLGATSYLKIIGLQVADFFAGAIPVVGDIADYFFKANKWSSSSFKKKTQELVMQARKAGVPEEEIAKITASADKLPRLVNRAVKIYKISDRKSKDAEPKLSQAA